jgi:hypothetical protein
MFVAFAEIRDTISNPAIALAETVIRESRAVSIEEEGLVGRSCGVSLSNPVCLS